MTDEQVVEAQEDMVMETPTLDEVNPPAEEEIRELASATEVVEDAPPVEEVAEVVAETLEDAEPPKEAEPTELDNRLSRIEKMLEQVSLSMSDVGLEDSDLSQSIAGIGSKARKAKPAQKSEPAESSVQVRRDLKSLITKQVHDRALESPEGFGEIIQAVYDTALLDAQENMMRNVTGIVEPLISQKFTIKNLTDDLYREHPSLFKVRRQVARVAKNIQMENPDLGPEEVFDTLRSEIKDKYSGWLDDPESEVPAPKSSKKKVVGPAIPMKAKKRTAIPAKLTGLQEEIQRMSQAGVPDME